MLIQENEKDNTELVEQSYSDTITLMNNIFKHLLPKGNYICRRRSIPGDQINSFLPGSQQTG